MQEDFNRLEQLKKDIEVRFGRFNNNQLNYKPSKDTWSLLQVTHHLMDAEKRAVIYINKKLLGAPHIKKAGFLSRLRLFSLKTAMALPIKYKAPKTLDSPPVHSEFDSMNREWSATREGMVEIMKSNDTDDLFKEIFRHPIAGRMNLTQAFQFMCEHIEHHLKQMDRIESDPGFPEQ